MVTLCLAGPEAERKFRCSINDGSDRVDYEMAREYLATVCAEVTHRLLQYRQASYSASAAT
jgi:hypothetical protein